MTPGLRKLFEAEGMPILGRDDGVAHFLRELQTSPAAGVEVVVLGTDARPATPPEIVAPVSHLETVLEFDLDPERFPFLRSHVLNGRAVVPMAMYLEWFAHTALHNHPGLCFLGLDNLRVMKGAVLHDGSLRLRFQAGRPRREDGRTIIPVELRSASNGQDVLHGRAEVVLGKDYPPPEGRLQVPERPAAFQAQATDRPACFTESSFKASRPSIPSGRKASRCESEQHRHRRRGFGNRCVATGWRIPWQSTAGSRR